MIKRNIQDYSLQQEEQGKYMMCPNVRGKTIFYIVNN